MALSPRRRRGRRTSDRRVYCLALAASGCYPSAQNALGYAAGVGPLLAAYLFWIGLSICWADQPIITLRRQVGFAMELSFCAGCVVWMRSERMATFLAGLAGLNLGVGLAQELCRGNFDLAAAGTRFAGTVDPNVQGASLSVAVILLCWSWWRSHGRERALLTAAIAVFAAFAILTRSRTSLVASVGALAFSGLIVFGRKYLTRPTRGTLMVVPIVLAVVVTGGLCPS